MYLHLLPELFHEDFSLLTGGKRTKRYGNWHADVIVNILALFTTPQLAYLALYPNSFMCLASTLSSAIDQPLFLITAYKRKCGVSLTHRKSIRIILMNRYPAINLLIYHRNHETFTHAYQKNYEETKSNMFTEYGYRVIKAVP